MRRAIVLRFRKLYVVFTTVCAVATMLLVAGWWKQGDESASGFPYSASLPILFVAALVVNSCSFFFQDWYVRRMLRRPDIAADFSIIIFVAGFYLINFAVALVISIIFYIPLIYLLFFYAIYPIIFWLMPYHLLSGLFLGRDIRRGLR